MPTGYTSIVEEGCSFEEYLWRCTRAFGAVYHMRDEGMDARVHAPKLDESGYHQTERRKAIARLAELDSMTLESAAALEKSERESTRKKIREWRKENAATRASYSKMRERVKAWQPPTEEHAGLKEFMLEQLRMGDPGEWVPDEPRPMTPKMWLAEQRAKAAKDVAYHSEQERKEEERVREAAEWIATLERSVPQPVCRTKLEARS